ncbi:hypothetical protein CEXT_384431 [Caerostris extrusa]|uniref:Uncharacterized protein n=1 Tax=Caerostris extrusa TaxID=172846 RepID=A0AAV4XRP3_CAEEX|nr:hypothetical protein CEXT_384431 [Caerostris extrusa]
MAEWLWRKILKDVKLSCWCQALTLINVSNSGGAELVLYLDESGVLKIYFDKKEIGKGKTFVCPGWPNGYSIRFLRAAGVTRSLWSGLANLVVSEIVSHVVFGSVCVFVVVAHKHFNKLYRFESNNVENYLKPISVLTSKKEIGTGNRLCVKDGRMVMASVFEGCWCHVLTLVWMDETGGGGTSRSV